MKSLRQRYDCLLEEGILTYDAKQVEIIALYDEFLANYKVPQPSFFSKFFASKFSKAEQKGFYIYGEVGRGKTMLMDLFHSCLSENSLRVHFHDFMKSVHEELNERRRFYAENKKAKGDPVFDIAYNLRKKAQIICFDEFTVTDIADAMILARLFGRLFELGLIFVATSNVAPDNLYKNGLNRQLFLPFIDILKNHVTIVNLDAPTDYRMEKTTISGRYFTPLSPDSEKDFQALWQEQIIQYPPYHAQSCEISLAGRNLTIPQACGPIAGFSFADICLKPLGANDFIALAHKFSIFFLDNVPTLNDDMRNSIKRFIIFIDVLYDQQGLLYMRAADRPEMLYPNAGPFVESFEFQRTISRLTEMQSEEYLTLHKKQHRAKLKPGS